MIVDGSAPLGVVLGEPDAERYARAIAGDSRPRMPSVTRFAAALRIEWAGDSVAISRFEDVPRIFGIDNIPFNIRHGEAARVRRRLCGRPSNKVGLNFAGCPVYGVAKSERESLLFKGSDFAQTDVEPALKD